MKSTTTRVIWQVAEFGNGLENETLASFPFEEQDAIEFARETNGSAIPVVQVVRSISVHGKIAL